MWLHYSLSFHPSLSFYVIATRSPPPTWSNISVCHNQNIIPAFNAVYLLGLQKITYKTV